MSASRIARVGGPGIVLAGHDIDTDRIMPARFLRAITFAGLEDHVFEDDRREAATAGDRHPFDDPDRRAARVLVVGRNFGCGSSREHAPQALRRWGIRAIVGESFAEIFFGNAVMIGLPCVTLPEDDAAALRARVAADAMAEVVVDLEARTVQAPGWSAACGIPEPSRQALVTGEWDATALLLADYAAVERVAARLPYLTGF